MEKTYKIGDKVVMKNNHACQTNEWTITRVGVDVKIKCIKCSREVMLDRLDFEKKVRRIFSEENKED